LLQTHVVDLPLANYLAQTCFFFLFRKRWGKGVYKFIAFQQNETSHIYDKP
jgi:hypothetical protein